MAWVWINGHYLSTSGLGLSAKRSWLMNPPKSAKDEDVMADIQKWTDEERELIALKSP